MPELFGTSYRRADLLRRIGRLEQVAGVRLVTLGEGQGRGVRVLEFRTGTGFAFDVLVDRGFDVGRCELGGRPLSWLSGAGVAGVESKPNSGPAVTARSCERTPFAPKDRLWSSFPATRPA